MMVTREGVTRSSKWRQVDEGGRGKGHDTSCGPAFVPVTISSKRDGERRSRKAAGADMPGGGQYTIELTACPGKVPGAAPRTPSSKKVSAYSDNASYRITPFKAKIYEMRFESPSQI